ncbi:MAG: hypothetical protein HY518_03560 [Candidatus Aenigmarchaeota archaeon]|nr:hypothetical protein [Candidatus Aenigmarchaeota archaeon]
MAVTYTFMRKDNAGLLLADFGNLTRYMEGEGRQTYLWSGPQIAGNRAFATFYHMSGNGHRVELPRKALGKLKIEL